MFDSARSRYSLIALLTAVVLTPASARADAALTLLGLESATGLSGDGSVVVGYQLSGIHQNAAYWTGGGVVTPLLTVTNAAFLGISADGSTMVGNGDNGSPLYVPFAYRAGATTLMPVVNPAYDAHALAANGDGSVIIGYGQNGSNEDRGYVWSGTNWQTVTAIDPQDPLGGTTVTAISADPTAPTIVGFETDHLSHANGFAWRNGARTNLSSGNGVGSTALGISADASTITGFIAPDSSHTDAAIWNGPNYATVTDIGNLGGDAALGVAASGDGSVVVGQSSTQGLTMVHAFRYASGHMDDLNTLLTSSGVDLSGKVLSQANAVSADGRYIAADSSDHEGYLVYYDDGIGGLTNGADQQASVNALGREWQAVTNVSQLYFGILDGDTDRHDNTSTAGVFGVAGSAVAGARGKWVAGNGFTLSGGIADGTTEAGDADVGNALFGAVSLRYDADAVNLGVFHPFVQAGVGEALLFDLSMTRPYASGSGAGTTAGSLTTAYLRAGVTGDFDNGDQASFAGELDSSWLSTAAYDEALSAHNMFPASIAAGSDQSTAVRASATWSHQLTRDVNLTLQAGLSADVGGSSGLQVRTTGFGTLAGAYAPAVWTDASAKLSWAVGAKSNLDVFAAGTLGGPQGNHAHVGVGFHVSE